MQFNLMQKYLMTFIQMPKLILKNFNLITQFKMHIYAIDVTQSKRPDRDTS